jgi:hypothetical protein
MARHESEMHRKMRIAEERLQAIANQLDGKEWNADTLQNIALVLRLAGYTIRKPATEEPTLLGLRVGGKAMAPPPFETEPVTIIGFRYHTGRHSGRTVMVADYVTRDGKQCFDAIERMKPVP